MLEMIGIGLAIGAAAAGLGLAAGLFVCRRRERRGAAALAAVVDAARHPAALTRLSGAVERVNPAMLRAAGGTALWIDELLAGWVEGSGAPAIYRLARAARESGFAFARTRIAASGELRYLTVWSTGEGRLVWSLLAEDELPQSQGCLVASPYDGAPFAHMRRAGPEPALVNTTFARLFGRDPEPVLSTLPERGRSEGDRVLLTGRDGQIRVFRAFAGTDETGAEELFLFPVGREGFLRTGPSRVLELVPVALAQFETDGALLWSNSRARAILGERASPGTAFLDLFIPLGRPNAAFDPEALAVESPGRGQMFQLRGSETFLQITLTRAKLYERETLIAVLTDASQLRQLEDQFAQSQKMEAVGKLAGGVAHDFNNVLTAIIGHCDLLLLRKDASHPDYSDLMQITQNANRAAALVRQLLAFSREQTLNPEVLSIQDVVTDTHYLLNRLVGETVRISLDMAPALWDVRADHQQLEQVLMNLVVNARDAMEGVGQITVSVANRRLASGGPAFRSAAPGDYVEIAIADTGPGIDPQVLDRVFDPFFTTKPKGEGTGLGLSTVYGIVKQSGGFIQADNLPEGGAVFRILLPRAEPAEPIARSETRPERRDLTGRGSVLLVEDEDPVRAFAARALELRGYVVAQAATAEEAMEILADREFAVDLLVSDVVMPGMDGPTFAAEARKMRPGLRLIFVSGYAEESFAKNLTETDFMFLPKPFTLNELTAKVKEALEDAPAA